MPNTIKYEDFINTNFDEFYIKNIIGTGGMGVVYRAFDKDLGRDVALKVLKKECINDENMLLERFKIEAINIAKLQHPNIINVFSIGFCHDLNYIVMEYVQGDKLSDLLHEKELTVLECLKIIYKVAKALEYSHKHGIIHRDIKPANIMISGPEKEVKVVDFGLSKTVYSDNNSISRFGDIIGTPVYLAPELWETSKNVSFKSDIYAMGVLLYECLTGKYPYEGKNNHEVYRSILLNNYKEAIKINPIISVELNILINKMLKRDLILRADIDYVISKLEKIITHYTNNANSTNLVESHADADVSNKTTVVFNEFSSISINLEKSFKSKEKYFWFSIVGVILSMLGVIWFFF